jgi:hypothetical protein
MSAIFSACRAFDAAGVVSGSDAAVGQADGSSDVWADPSAPDAGARVRVVYRFDSEGDSRRRRHGRVGSPSDFPLPSG